MSTPGGQHAQEPTSISMADTVVESPSSSPVASRFLDIKPPLVSTPESVPNPDALLRDHSTHTVPPTIPPEHNGRTLILCFDGTGDQFDADNSNIVQLMSLLKKNDKTKQMVYYQSGIGTYTTPKVATPFMSRIRKTLDEMFAWNLHSHVMGGYEFLMQNYIAGDKICIFGFSRGAYTARSLAGMIHKVGLLPADNIQQVPFAYKMYTKADYVGWEQSNEFKKAFSVDVPIEFIGVWDTVDSVGLIPKRLPFTTSNTIVRTFRHAVALDERRAKFKPNLWNRPTKDEEKLGIVQLTKSETVDSSSSNGSSSHSKKNGNGNKKHKESKDDRMLSTHERMYSERSTIKQLTDIEEVWFAGCHCDVGGGSVSNKTPNSLARIPLRWMIRECFKTKTGIMFDSEALKEIGLDPSTLYPEVIKRPDPLPLGSARITKPPSQPIPVRLHARLAKKLKHPELYDGLHDAVAKRTLVSEEDEELKDALSPKYDQLSLKKSWWILEILPLHLRYQRGDNTWVNQYGPNLAKPRFIPKQIKNGYKVHRSVKLRMEAEYENEDERKSGKKYVPKPEFRAEPTWVD